ncbi:MULTISPECIES: methionyl-tRNA formyltransferase [unclassified Butyrivibrio]|uniref:methionyl-tRNA formyltransferase n=1 Tax=unclassified Butyrivibrio TaxID=2639466 RepID=UPI0003B3C413|nr:MULTISPECIES: methionyl-tRNA formyltransferase [unclassified Butyrivibrio]
MKIVYMGTPDFSVPPLEKMIEAGHEIVAVVTQPDKPKGRSDKLVPSPVKECALKHGLKIMQPKKIREAEVVEELKSLGADIFVVAAFGQILSQEVLDIPKFGCVNIHASLLPKYRGAAPIQMCILNGDKTTGVTIMQMNAGMDTGDMLITKEIPIEEDDTAGTLFDKLMYLGADLIVEALPKIEKGELTPTPQNDAEATKCGKISKDMGQINWNDDASKISYLVRGMNPWPSAYTHLNGKMLKIWTAKVQNNTSNGNPGTIAAVNKDSFTVNTGDGLLEITELQLEGKKRMDVKSFLLGYTLNTGDNLE